MGVTTHQPQSRISAAFDVQPVYTQLLCYITLHIHFPAVYSNVATDTSAVPCKVSAYALTVLPGCFYKHHVT